MQAGGLGGAAPPARSGFQKCTSCEIEYVYREHVNASTGEAQPPSKICFSKVNELCNQICVHGDKWMQPSQQYSVFKNA